MKQKNTVFILCFLLFTTGVLYSQTLAARISNGRVEGDLFLWDVEVSRTDDWGSNPGDDILGNCDFYFTLNAEAFTAADPVISGIHAALSGNGKYGFRTGRAASGTQAWIALDYDVYGTGSNWQPPLDTWETLFTVSLPLQNAGAPSGLAWHATLTGFSRANMYSLTAILTGSDASIRLRLKVFLEGPYASGSMTAALNTGGLLPAVSPYMDARDAGTVPSGVTDWIYVELRETVDGPAVSGRSFFVKTGGTVVETDGTTEELTFYNAAEGDYHIVVTHRNHLQIISADSPHLAP